MSAGPKSVAPVSRPATVTMAESIRCSMKGRAMTISIGTQLPFATSFLSSVQISAVSLALV